MSDQLDELPPGVMDVILRNDMASFLRVSFAEVVPGAPLVWNEYLDLICSRLAAVVTGEIPNLIITMPPRHLKSMCVSVALPAFFLGHYPSAEVMAVSYGQELARKFAEDTRTVMASDTYRRIFPTRLASTRQASHALRTVQGGIRRATSIDGAATGVGADLLIFDDPQKPNETLSDAVRRSTNEAFESTFLSRRNDPATCRIVIVMQRLHEDDFVGHVLSMPGKWVHLNLPATAETDECYDYDSFMGRHQYRRRSGEALHPTRVPLSELINIRERIGEATYTTQFMQRPAPAGGGLVNTNWFRRYTPEEKPAEFERIIQSWDTANTIADWSKYSACTTWGQVGNKLYLLDILRAKLLYPDLKRAVLAQAARHGANYILIEDRASGTQLIQDLQQAGYSGVLARKAIGDKHMRMSAQTAPIEAGFIYIPAEAPWLADFLHEFAVFPNGLYDDQVDSTSQALAFFGNPLVPGWAFLEMAREENRRRALSRPSPVARTFAVGSVEWAAQQRDDEDA